MSALHGLKVLDLSRVLAGPLAGQLLADLGAEVTKVERPGEGDDTRRWGPPFLADEEGAATPESAYYLSANRGKASVTIDLTRPEGQALVRRLAAGSDVVIENFKRGGLARYGLDYPALKALNPRLVYCSITGFGQDGPYADRPGYDLLVQGMSGLMSITGEADGEPMKTGVAITDLCTGLYAALAILAALAHRERSGEGQHIDLALLDVATSLLSYQANNYLVGGKVPARMGNAHPSIVPYQVFATADGHLLLAVGNDGQFRAFCEAAACPGLASDERYAGNRSRVAHREELIARLAPVLRGRTTADWLHRLGAAGVPCGPINTVDQVFADPQLRHRGMVLELEHPLAPALRLLGNPIRLSATPLACRRAPPRLGADTGRVLAERLGLDEADIRRLRAEAVI